MELQHISIDCDQFYEITNLDGKPVYDKQFYNQVYSV